MSLSRPLKSLKIRLFSTFQILENCYQIRKKALTVWKFQTIKVILYSKLHFMFSHDFFISLAESFALKLDKTICPVICGLFKLYRSRWLARQIIEYSIDSLNLIDNSVHNFIKDFVW